MAIPRCYDAFVIDGQRYTWIGDHAHTRRDNKITIMASWQAACRGCGQLFVIHHAQRPAPAYPKRQCDPCVARDAATKRNAALNSIPVNPDDAPPNRPTTPRRIKPVSRETGQHDPHTTTNTTEQPQPQHLATPQPHTNPTAHTTGQGDGRAPFAPAAAPSPPGALSIKPRNLFRD